MNGEVNEPMFRPGSSNRIDRLRVRDFRLLELAARTGSLTAAAQVLCIGQPTATKMLQELERAFGCTLMDRTTRGGTLTSAGERVLERLRIATGSLDVIGLALASHAALPLVRIGMLPLAGVSLVPRIVARLSRAGQLPRLHLIEDSVAGVLSLLRNGEIDCVIGRTLADGSGPAIDEFNMVPLSDESLEVACGRDNPIARMPRPGLRELREHPWILPDRDTYTRQVLDRAFASQGLVPPKAHIEGPSFHTNLATVAQSNLLTVAPRSAVDYYGVVDQVVRLRLATPLQIDMLVFITLRNAPRLPALDVIQTALQQAVDHPASSTGRGTAVPKGPSRRPSNGRASVRSFD